MNRHQFLRRLHEISRPRTYVEIGVNDGRSLALSRCRTVAVDPAYRLTSEVHCDLRLVRATSDDFFARDEPLAHLGDEPVVDLAFIDGMHLFEYVLRDFANIERYADRASVIVFDDLLPRRPIEAARNRQTGGWTGDVFKIIPVLQRYRPELRLAVMDTQPTGVMVVLGAERGNAILTERYDEIMEQFLVKDPQQVPDELLTRSAAIDPEAFLAAPFWESLATARGRGDQAYGREEFLADVDRTLADLPRPRLATWLPDPSTGRDEEAVASVVSVGEAGMRAQREARANANAEATTGAMADAGPGSATKPAGGRAGRTAARSAGRTPGRTAARSDLPHRLAARFPFLRKVPGARAVARLVR